MELERLYGVREGSYGKRKVLEATKLPLKTQEELAEYRRAPCGQLATGRKAKYKNNSLFCPVIRIYMRGILKNLPFLSGYPNIYEGYFKKPSIFVRFNKYSYEGYFF